MPNIFLLKYNNISSSYPDKKNKIKSSLNPIRRFPTFSFTHTQKKKKKWNTKY